MFARWLTVLAFAFAPTAADAEVRPCTMQTDCHSRAGEFCLNGTCRSANDHRVERLFTIAVAPIYDLTPRGEGRALTETIPPVLRGLLQSTVFFRVLPATKTPLGAKLEGWTPSTIAYSAWSDAGAYAVVKGVVERIPGGDLVLRLQLHLVETGETIAALDDQRLVTTQTVRQELIDWCDEVVQYFAGRPGILGSRIAYARLDGKPGSPKEIHVVGMDGVRETPVTNNGSLNMLPSWGPDGVRIAYTSYVAKNPDLYLDGKPLSTFESLNIGAEWSPDGREVAIALGKDGNSEIYVLDGRTGTILRRLTYHSAIDSSPTWDPEGRRLAFVSDRGGSPQIYVMNQDGSGLRKISSGHSYCTSPDWSPQGTHVAYNAMVGSGKFDLFILDVDTGNKRRLTRGRGSNEDPSWSPDSRYLVFSSTRDSTRGVKRRQLYIISAAGGEAIRLTRREAVYSTPVWSPR